MSGIRRIRTGALATVAMSALALGLTTNPANADGGAYPSLTGEVTIEVQNDGAFSSDDPANELNDLYNTTEAALALNFNEALSIQTTSVLESVLDPGPGEDRFFEDHGAYMEEVYLQFEAEGFRVFGGKFDAAFGTAWDAGPGIWGADFAEDYELVERIGGGGAFTFGGGDSGKHTVTAAAFFVDTSALSESIITNRGRTRIGAGGASNTESLESFSIALDSEEIPGLPDTTFHAAFRHQAAGRGDFADENGFVFGVQKTFELEGEQSLETILEGAYFDNADAGPDNRFYLTAGGTFKDGPWNAALSYTLRHKDLRRGGTGDDHLFQATGGYEFENGVTVDGGYRFSEEAGVATHILGFLVTKSFEIGG